ncbi:MAG: nucleotidyltransferase family protein [Candidatus Aminicenantes bacterium]|nr:nucleotidyltransferase family protein [Candidatus Aminicenantes bacterium]
MKSIERLTLILRKNKPTLKKKYAVNKLGIFGSYARGEETPGSDVDVLVQLGKPIGLDFVTLADELEELLGVEVDLVSANAVKPRMMEQIEKELVYV